VGGTPRHARNLFAFSILYLFALFAALLAEAVLGSKRWSCCYDQSRKNTTRRQGARGATSPWAWAWRPS
jgi:hypothetical protein